MKLKIFHTVNAGLYLWDGKSGLLIDALHDGTKNGFSATPQKYIDMMERRESFFGQQNDLLFTHKHPDHYDPQIVSRFLTLNPESLIYLPDEKECNVRACEIEEGVKRMSIRDYHIVAFATKHDGKKFSEYPHYSYLVEALGECIWVSGDAVFDRPLTEKIRRVCGRKKIIAAFANVYQFENKQSMDFLEELGANQLYLYHLPFLKDDAFHYQRMANTVLNRRCRAGYRILPAGQEQFLR